MRIVRHFLLFCLQPGTGLALMPNPGFATLQIESDFPNHPEISTGECIHQVPWFRQAKGAWARPGCMNSDQPFIRQNLTPIG